MRIMSIDMFYHIVSHAVTIPIRLTNGPSEFAGRVEVYIDGEWGTVCDDSWDIRDGHVVCHQLGYGRALATHGVAHYGQGTGVIAMDDVGCSGEEINLFSCSYVGSTAHNCRHTEDAGVECAGFGES